MLRPQASASTSGMVFTSAAETGAPLPVPPGDPPGAPARPVPPGTPRTEPPMGTGTPDGELVVGDSIDTPNIGRGDALGAAGSGDAGAGGASAGGGGVGARAATRRRTGGGDGRVAGTGAGAAATGGGAGAGVVRKST